MFAGFFVSTSALRQSHNPRFSCFLALTGRFSRNLRTPRFWYGFLNRPIGKGLLGGNRCRHRRLRKVSRGCGADDSDGAGVSEVISGAGEGVCGELNAMARSKLCWIEAPIWSLRGGPIGAFVVSERLGDNNRALNMNLWFLKFPSVTHRHEHARRRYILSGRARIYLFS